MDIYSNARRPVYKGREMIKKSKTEQLGYVTTEQKVTSMLKAGLRLQASRLVYGSNDPNVEPEMMPTIAKDFDLAEGSMYLDSVRDKLNSLLKERKIEVKPKTDVEVKKATDEVAP